MPELKPLAGSDDRGKPIVVIGSINMDLVCRAERIPKPGETILGRDLVMVPGGKGANQAVAVARLGGNVQMIGRVGDDDLGTRLLSGLTSHHVQTDYVTITEGVASGCAVILVDAKGENSIVVSPGANARLTPADIDAAEELIASAACVVLQLEIPLATVKHVIALCKRVNVSTILDPAPVPSEELDRQFFGVSVLTPNQSEAELLVGQPRDVRLPAKKIIDPKQIGTELVARGAECVVLKLGRKGAMIVDREGRIEHIKAFKPKVIDTTAAGDAFTGALAIARSEGMEMPSAVRFANAAGALACETFGAQPSLPTRKAVEKLLKEIGR